jgi:hypothetical protein
MTPASARAAGLPSAPRPGFGLELVITARVALRAARRRFAAGVRRAWRDPAMLHWTQMP